MNTIKEIMGKDTFNIMKDYIKDLIITDIDNKKHKSNIHKCLVEIKAINYIISLTRKGENGIRIDKNYLMNIIDENIKHIINSENWLNEDFSMNITLTNPYLITVLS